jgi:hypothetical protein
MRWRGHALVEVEGFFKSCVKRKLLIAEAEVRCLNVKLNSSIFFSNKLLYLSWVSFRKKRKVRYSLSWVLAMEQLSIQFIT